MIRFHLSPAYVPHPNMRLLLINPNMSAATTDAMLAIARGAAPAGLALTGVTASSGAALITNETQLAIAADAVLDALSGGSAAACDGVIISAFGDPGLIRARERLDCPVTGIAEAGMAEAGAEGRFFAVATTTPDLAAAISAAAAHYGHGERFRGVWLTPGDPAVLMADPKRLEAALEAACLEAIAAGAAAVVIGGGPLAVAARALATRLPVPIIEPIPAAIRLAWRRATARAAP